MAAVLAPALHSASDVLEWARGGFSAGQLWLNYAAFLPMPWLLLGIYAVHERRPGNAALAGALLYGAAFTYFAHSTLYALAEGLATYEALWARLGAAYTLHGGLMVVGGLTFAAAVFRRGRLPRAAVGLFAAGLAANLLLWLAPAPEILQTAGSLIRNLGLIGMGLSLLRGPRDAV